MKTAPALRKACSILIVLAAACSSDETQPRLAVAPIGVATMELDGTIVLMLRAEGPGGMVGDARIPYAPTHPDYAMVLRHVGGLANGESKPVPPFEEPDG